MTKPPSTLPKLRVGLLRQTPPLRCSSGSRVQTLSSSATLFNPNGMCRARSGHRAWHDRALASSRLTRLARSRQGAGLLPGSSAVAREIASYLCSSSCIQRESFSGIEILLLIKYALKGHYCQRAGVRFVILVANPCAPGKVARHSKSHYPSKLHGECRKIPFQQRH